MHPRLEEFLHMDCMVLNLKHYSRISWGAAMENILFFISAGTLAFGAGLGVKGMLDPSWAGHLVRLQPENGQPEGYAEFRATFGGMFLGLHLSALTFLVMWRDQAGVAACAILAAGWLFTAMGRYLSYSLDAHTQHGHVVRSVAIEVIIGLAIAAWPMMRLLSGQA